MQPCGSRTFGYFKRKKVLINGMDLEHARNFYALNKNLIDFYAYIYIGYKYINKFVSHYSLSLIPVFCPVCLIGKKI